jgi:hypothetical protein
MEQIVRTAESIKMGASFPEKGKYPCVVIDVLKGVSKGEKKTPYVEPVFSNGEDEFSDSLYVTPKTVGRLCMFAQRVCGMPKDFQLPDDDKEAANEVARFIMTNSIGKKCIVTIEEHEEMFMPTSGPDAGRNITKKRRRVAFRGYDRHVDAQHGVSQKDEDLPF